MKKIDGFHRGVNLGGWLSQCVHTQEHYDTFITESDLRTIHEWGLDHVRIPVDYDLLETQEGAYRPEGFERLRTALGWCEKNHLNAIIDLHKTFGYSFDKGEGESGFFDNEADQERFYRLWEQIAEHFGDRTEHVMFELLNEVTDKGYLSAWQRIYSTCIERIRRIAPKVRILVGGYWNNAVSAVKDLLPPQDENIIYNFHCYDPLLFTHQGAHWVENMPLDFRFAFAQSMRTYADTTYKVLPQMGHQEFTDEVEAEKILGPDYFRAIFAEAVATAKERNVALYCGEYGVIDLAEHADCLAWYKAIHEVFEENGIARAAWSYRGMNFGIADAAWDAERDQLIALM